MLDIHVPFKPQLTNTQRENIAMKTIRTLVGVVLLMTLITVQTTHIARAQYGSPGGRGN
jgi:hypothetical protein